MLNICVTEGVFLLVPYFYPLSLLPLYDGGLARNSRLLACWHCNSSLALMITCERGSVLLWVHHIVWFIFIVICVVVGVYDVELNCPRANLFRLHSLSLRRAVAIAFFHGTWLLAVTFSRLGVMHYVNYLSHMKKLWHMLSCCLELVSVEDKILQCEHTTIWASLHWPQKELFSIKL